MDAIDPKTIERLARIIVDPDGPYVRTGRQLEALLAQSGWPDPPEYDGSPKVAWLIEQMEDRNDHPGDIERLLCRVCDPLEYDEGDSGATVFREALNAVLKPEGIVILDTGGRPVLAELGTNGFTAVNAEPRDLDDRIRRLVGDAVTAELLSKRAAEARVCQQGGAYTMAVIAIGSLVEGLLYTFLTEQDEESRNHRFVGRDGNVITDRRPALETLINTAFVRNWIQLDAKAFMHTVRDFRNYIHPRKELADNPDFDNDTVGLCWAPLQAMLNDLEERFRAGEGGPSLDLNCERAQARAAADCPPRPAVRV